jgi:alpha-1,4-galacturonosyltransferase
MKAMARLLAKVRDLRYDDKVLVKRLKSMLEASENQSNFLSQLAAKTVPKGLHCLSMRLTVSYNALPPEECDFPATPELEDNSLYHYAIFSDNVLAVSVVVNSTVVNAKVSMIQ